MTHAARSPSDVAVVTGGASGIGFSAAQRFAADIVENRPPLSRRPDYAGPFKRFVETR